MSEQTKRVIAVLRQKAKLGKFQHDNNVVSWVGKEVGAGEWRVATLHCPGLSKE